MRKIKIVFIIHKAYMIFNENVHQIAGGAEINLYNIAKKLAESGEYEVDFIVGDYDQNDIEFYSGIKVIKMKYHNTVKYSKIVHKFLRLFSLLKVLVMSDGDVYITSTASKLLGQLVIIEKFLKRKKVIYRIASDLDTNPKLCKNKEKGLAFWYLLGLKNSDVIIAQSEKQKSELKKNTGVDSIVIKNGFFIKDYSNNVSIKKESIIWVSRYDTMKRPELFIELARRLPKEEFILVMPCDKDLLPAILKNIDYPPNVKYIGFVPFTATYEYYLKAKLLINTSEYEGFPNTFIQACLSKTPILSFRVNPDNFIIENNVGLMCEDNIDKAVEFITGLNKEKIFLYGDNAFKYVKENHDIIYSAALYDDIIKRFLKR